MAPPAHEPLSCTFCGKRKEEVAHLIVGPAVFICGECVSLCRDIASEEIESPSPGLQPPVLRRFTRLFAAIAEALETHPAAASLAEEARRLARELKVAGVARR